MNSHLLKDDVQDFIHNFSVKEIHSLVLKGYSFEGITVQELAVQIESLNLLRKKVPLFSRKGLIFPKKMNVEQTSSQLTATYKKQLVGNLHSFIDCTGGFGVDTFFIAQNAQKSTYCELNNELSDIVKHNFNQLNADIEVINSNGIEFLQNTEDCFDCTYLDPSRRSYQGKVISIEQSQPNILEYWDVLLDKSSRVMVKLSPMLDIDYLIRKLPFLSELHILSIKNDVKEILVVASRRVKADNVKLFSVELKSHTAEIYASEANSEFKQPNIYTTKKKFSYIYEPLGCLLKANLQDQYAIENGLVKLAPKSNFFLSDEQIDLPLMKIFKIKEQLPFKRKEIVSFLPSKQVNVVTRNFPVKPEEVLKKLKIKQGGDNFLLCSIDAHKKFVCFLANRV